MCVWMIRSKVSLSIQSVLNGSCYILGIQILIIDGITVWSGYTWSGYINTTVIIVCVHGLNEWQLKNLNWCLLLLEVWYQSADCIFSSKEKDVLSEVLWSIFGLKWLFWSSFAWIFNLYVMDCSVHKFYSEIIN